VKNNPSARFQVSRRTFLAGAGGAAALVTAAGCGDDAKSTTTTTAPTATALTDTDILTEGQRKKPKLEPDDVARAVLYALQQPPSVDVNEILVRPTGQVL